MLFGNRIAPVHTVRDLGVMLDSNMFIVSACLASLPELLFPNWADPSIGLNQNFYACMHWFKSVGLL